jgi:hypothetical protein
VRSCDNPSDPASPYHNLRHPVDKLCEALENPGAARLTGLALCAHMSDVRQGATYHRSKMIKNNQGVAAIVENGQVPEVISNNVLPIDIRENIALITFCFDQPWRGPHGLESHVKARVALTSAGIDHLVGQLQRLRQDIRSDRLHA